MKASDLFVQCLETEGIEYIFGVPGEENADFMMSLEQSDQIQFVLTRHEQGAAFMAEVYGRLTGQPAGCLGTLGPGATNLITGVADSNMQIGTLDAILAGPEVWVNDSRPSEWVLEWLGSFPELADALEGVGELRDPRRYQDLKRNCVYLGRTIARSPA